MHNWLGVAMVAYGIGAAVEGVNAVNQLSHSSLGSTDNDDHHTSESANPPPEKWRIFAAIAAVSLCGAAFWPCRLLHRSIKAAQPCGDDSVNR